MSEIDRYQHECIGIVHCPSDYEIIYGNNSHRDIPLYRLNEDAFDVDWSFQAKKGDLLLGGGVGESAAFRVSIPEAVYLFTREDCEDFDDNDEIFHAYWWMTQAYIFGDGYTKVGWNPTKRDLEFWLAEHIIAFILREYPDLYGRFQGTEALEEDGSILRLPTQEERAKW